MSMEKIFKIKKEPYKMLKNLFVYFIHFCINKGSHRIWFGIPFRQNLTKVRPFIFSDLTTTVTAIEVFTEWLFIRLDSIKNIRQVLNSSTQFPVDAE